jgi:DNA-binding GntR family transcriptional regulator
MNRSQAERLRSMIEEEILTFQLKPGDRLDETRLAERYGTSRTPVREALRQLSANGLIEIRPHKGAVVAKLGIRKLTDRNALDAFKAYLASDLQAILTALEVCQRHVAVNDVQGYKSANESFHDAIYYASRNSYLISLTFSVRKRLAAYRRLQFDQPNRIKASVEDHERIAYAIRDGLPEEADRLLQLHVLSIGGELRRFISMVSATECTPPASEPVVFKNGTALQPAFG